MLLDVLLVDDIETMIEKKTLQFASPPQPQLCHLILRHPERGFAKSLSFSIDREVAGSHLL